jgi:hypothetical protein
VLCLNWTVREHLSLPALDLASSAHWRHAVVLSIPSSETNSGMNSTILKLQKEKRIEWLAECGAEVIGNLNGLHKTVEHSSLLTKLHSSILSPAHL